MQELEGQKVAEGVERGGMWEAEEDTRAWMSADYRYKAEEKAALEIHLEQEAEAIARWCTPGEVPHNHELLNSVPLATVSVQRRQLACAPGPLGLTLRERVMQRPPRLVVEELQPSAANTHLGQLPLQAQLLELDGVAQFARSVGKCGNELLLKGNQRSRRMLFQILTVQHAEGAEGSGEGSAEQISVEGGGEGLVVDDTSSHIAHRSWLVKALQAKGREARAQALLEASTMDVDEGHTATVNAFPEEQVVYFRVEAPAGQLGLVFEENKVSTRIIRMKLHDCSCVQHASMHHTLSYIPLITAG
jgi:hypothetical protein